MTCGYKLNIQQSDVLFLVISAKAAGHVRRQNSDSAARTDSGSTAVMRRSAEQVSLSPA